MSLLPAPPERSEPVTGLAQGFLVAQGMLLNGCWTLALCWAAVWVL